MAHDSPRDSQSGGCSSIVVKPHPWDSLTFHYHHFDDLGIFFFWGGRRFMIQKFDFFLWHFGDTSLNKPPPPPFGDFPNQRVGRNGNLPMTQ